MRGEEFLEGLDGANVGVACASPALKDLLQSTDRNEHHAPIALAIRALLSTTVTAYENHTVLEKQAEYAAAGYPNDLRVELNNYASRNFSKPYLLSQSCEHKVLLLASTQEFEYLLVDLTQEQMQEIKECIESLKGSSDPNLTYKVLGALEKVQVANKKRRGFTTAGGGRG